MQLKVRKLAWVLGGISAIGVTSLIAVACSTDNGDTPVPGTDASRADTRPTATATGTTPPGTDGGPQDDGGGPGPDCGFVPRLRPPVAGDAAAPDATTSFFCPFGDGGTAGSDKRFCGGEQTCCSGTAGPTGQFDTSFCTVAKADTCGSGAAGARVRWECASPETCGAAQKCCIPGTDAGPPAVDTEKVNGKTCPAEYQRGFYIGGSLCRTECQGGELTVCTKDADCTGGKKCVAFTTNSRDMGYCK